MEQIPRGIKVISIWHYIQAVLSMIIFILLIIFYLEFEWPWLVALTILVPFLYLIFITIFFFSFGGLENFIFIGIAFYLIFAIFFFLVGRNLVKGKKWARANIILISIINIILIIILLFVQSLDKDIPASNLLSFLSLILHTLIGGYLLFSKKVKEFFSMNP